MSTVDESHRQMLNCEIVVDVSSLYVYVGTLVETDQHYLILKNADVHDLRDTATTRELYVLETKQLGVRSNRKQVRVARDKVVSISALDDVID